MSKIKKIAMSIGSFFAYNEKHLYAFIWSMIFLLIVLVSYLFSNEGSWQKTILGYVIVIAAFLFVIALANYIICLCLTNYNRKLDMVRQAEEKKKNEFETIFLSKKYKNRPVFDALSVIFSYEDNEKAKRVTRIFYVAKQINMITIEPTCADAKKYFGDKVVGAGGNYSETQGNLARKPIVGDELQAIATMLTNTLEKIEEQSIQEKPQNLVNRFKQYISNLHKPKSA